MIAHTKDLGVDLKRVTAEVSSDRLRPKVALWTRKRSARTPPSTFLFLPIHMSNSLRPGGLTPPGFHRRAVEVAPHPIGSDAVSPDIREEPRRRAIAPRRRRAERVFYRPGPAGLSTLSEPENDVSKSPRSIGLFGYIGTIARLGKMFVEAPGCRTPATILPRSSVVLTGTFGVGDPVSPACQIQRCSEPSKSDFLL
jgi:hypothetical protein